MGVIEVGGRAVLDGGAVMVAEVVAQVRLKSCTNGPHCPLGTKLVGWKGLFGMSMILIGEHGP